MKIDSSDFRVREGDEVSLQKWPTDVTPVYKSKHQYKELLEGHVVKLSALQKLLSVIDLFSVAVCRRHTTRPR